MILAASNIAWNWDQRLEAYQLLQSAGFTGLEIAPGLFLSPDFGRGELSDSFIAERLSEVSAFGLTLVSMQSLLFGVEGAALFGDRDEVGRFVDGMGRAIRLAGRLDVRNLVFGSPRQRVVPAGMAWHDVRQRMADVFGRLGDLALENGAVIALEPNPAQYGTNFMVSLEDTLAMVDDLSHPGITLNFDTGALHMAGTYDRVAEAVAASCHSISHVHVSRPFLEPAPSSSDEGLDLLRALNTEGYCRAVSIEMKAVSGDELGALGDAVHRLARAVLAAGLGQNGEDAP